MTPTTLPTQPLAAQKITLNNAQLIIKTVFCPTLITTALLFFSGSIEILWVKNKKIIKKQMIPRDDKE